MLVEHQTETETPYISFTYLLRVYFQLGISKPNEIRYIDMQLKL